MRASTDSIALRADALTVVEAWAVRDGWFVAVRVASFEYVPVLEGPVALTTWTASLDPGVRSTAVQWSVSLGALPWIEQLAGPDWMDQSMPGPVGNGSSMTTPRAVAVPASLLFDAVIVNPIWDPAWTVDASAVFVNVTFGQTTVVAA